MMKRISYKKIRHATFLAYILFVVLFCLFLLYLGKKEVLKAQTYAENERFYLETLLATRDTLNSLNDAFNEVLREMSSENISRLIERAEDFRISIGKLTTIKNQRDFPYNEIILNLQENAQLLYSVSNTFPDDLKTPSSDAKLLMGEDFDEFSAVLKETGDKTQQLLRGELDHVEIWQNQSLFFFKRLQYLLVLFSVLTTLFSAGASFLFGYMLNHSLKQLSEGTREISSGNLEYKFDNIQSDEVGQVMHDFNLMVRRLKEQTETLQKINQELNEKALQLTEANRHKDRFLANMSHELRTPLNSIIGFSELIIRRAKNDAKPDEKTANFAKIILDASEHLLELISGLLEIAKSDAGVLAPSFRKFSLGNCIESMVSILRPLAENKNITLISELLPDVNLISDEKMLRQILINLIGNAVKFTHQGRILLRTSLTEDLCLIEVEDTGIGISEEEQKHIFKDFHRVETGLTSNYEGVGLGLTLTKRLVELLGGDIKVKSSLGAGSTFSISLPLRKAPAADR